jgi:hypothetical protein
VKKVSLEDLFFNCTLSIKEMVIITNSQLLATSSVGKRRNVRYYQMNLMRLSCVLEFKSGMMQTLQVQTKKEKD